MCNISHGSVKLLIRVYRLRLPVGGQESYKLLIFISRNLPHNMGMLELLLIDEWLSQEMQSGLDKSKRFGDLKKLRIELEKRIQDHKDQSG